LRANLLRPKRRAQIELQTTRNLGVDATRKIPGEGLKRPWPGLIKMDEAVKAKAVRLIV
jgi:4-hydroxy-3-polyprenylbenzoate decarboxylase